MQLIRGLNNLQKLSTPCVATIGSFDAIHLGHQSIISRVKHKAAALNIASAVMLFEPQPREFFTPDSAPLRVLRLRDKIMVLQQLGIDYVICLHFNKTLSCLTKAQFVQNVIVDGLQAKYLVVGDDFRFGQGREGDFDYLARQGKTFQFSVEPTPTVEHEGRRVSSTWVREALQAADFGMAHMLLNRSYQLHGKIQRCDQRGRQIGFPTANIGLEHEMVLRGVYVVRVTGLEREYTGVANIGKRPTVDGLKRMLEVHILDFDQDIYGQVVTVEFLKQLRQEQKFATVSDLVQQITKDVKIARDFLGHK